MVRAVPGARPLFEQFAADFAGKVKFAKVNDR